MQMLTTEIHLVKLNSLCTGIYKVYKCVYFYHQNIVHECDSKRVYVSVDLPLNVY